MTLPTHSKFAVLRQLNQPLTIEELEIPQLQPGQVLVKIAYAGVCHSQLNEVRGKKGEDKFLPHLLGHEASGYVLAIGNGVTQVKPDDRVILSWIKGPGMNAPAPKYRNKEGQTINAGQVAVFGDYAVVSENRCTAFKSEISMQTAALLGCAVPTGAGMVIRQLNARPGESLIVFGAGGIGLSSILAGDLMNCYPIVAVDLTQEKLDFAKKLGATHGVLFSNLDQFRQDMRNILPQGGDLVVEATGVQSGMEAAYTCIKEGGGKMVFSGNLPQGKTISIDPFELLKGKTLLGTAGGQTDPSKDYPLYARLQSEGKFNFEKLATSIFQLEQINQVFDKLEAGALGRLLLKFE